LKTLYDVIVRMIANSNGARVNIGYSYFASADVNM